MFLKLALSFLWFPTHIQVIDYTCSTLTLFSAELANVSLYVFASIAVFFTWDMILL
jgi:hypothetical protein